MGGKRKILTTNLLVAFLLVAPTATATALVIPGRDQYESRQQQEYETPSYYRQGGFIYSYPPPEREPEGRDLRFSRPSSERQTYDGDSSLEKARRQYWGERTTSEVPVDEPERRIIRYRNPTRSSRYHRGSTGLRIPGRYESTGLRSGSTHAVASWYGWDFHGQRTANGEIYNMYKHTAAHRTLPFGTIVRVTNLSNGRQAVVRINDRGPFIKGRDIDLSYATARELGMVNSGVEEVQLEILSG